MCPEVGDPRKEHLATFIKESRKTTPAAGCHIMAVGFEDIVKEIIAAAGTSCLRLTQQQISLANDS